MVYCHHPSTVWKMRISSIYFFYQKYFCFSAWYIFVGNINEITHMVLLLIEHSWSFSRNTIRCISLFVFNFFRGLIKLDLRICVMLALVSNWCRFPLRFSIPAMHNFNLPAFWLSNRPLIFSDRTVCTKGHEIVITPHVCKSMK